MLQTKALYNLLRLNADEDSTIEAEKWALEDLRLLSPEKLFARLETLGVKLDKGTFSQFAENCDTPEDLTDLLLPDQGEDTYDQFYLCIFELWRQLVPEKQSLSIFCDELDNRIYQYDQGILDNDEIIQDSLANLMEILDENADLGVEPKEIFNSLTEYCAHDLEGFLYDYICEQIDAGYFLYAA